MARRIREEVIEDVPVTRRVVTEHRTGAPAGWGMNPIGAVVAAVLVVFILVLVFGYLL